MKKHEYGEYGDYGDAPAGGPGPGDARAEAPASVEPGAAIVGGGLTLVATAAVVCACAVMGAWLIGEVVSDRLTVTQYLEWIPTKLVILGAVVAMVVAKVCLALGSVMRRPAAWVKRLVRGAWLAVVLMAGYYVLFEAPQVRGRPEAPAPGDDALRLVFWNMSGGIGTILDQHGRVVDRNTMWETIVGAESGDIVVITSVVAGKELAALAANMQTDTFTVVPAAPFTVLSRRAVTRWGGTALNLRGGEGWDPRLPEGWKMKAYPGYAMFFEVECPGKGTTPADKLVMWVVDMPSDLSLSKWKLVRDAREAIDDFHGEVYVPGPDGRWVVGEPRTDSARGFPKPDLIVGDFNIPRGSASLNQIDEALPNAYDQAGRGDMSSFPRIPLVHIDQTFVGPKLRAWRYDVKPVGRAPHRMQVVDLAREAPK